tara:strand:- start:65 stop:1099 length:1035 start_codon:yes stop_codon:yes gene_type:complete
MAATSPQITKQMFQTFFENLSIEEKKSLAKELGLQEITRKNKKTKNITENAPFDHKRCHARLLVSPQDENGNNLCHSKSSLFHFNQIAVQCCGPIDKDGLCKTCLKPDHRIRTCDEKGIIPFGKYNDDLDQNAFTRISRNAKDKHTYYIKGKSIDDEHRIHFSETPTTIPKKIKYDSQDSKSQEDIDWQKHLADDTIHKIPVKSLKAFLSNNNIDIPSKKIDKVNAVKVFLTKENEKNQVEQNPQTDTTITQDPEPQTPEKQDPEPQDPEPQDDIDEDEDEDVDEDEDIAVIDIQGVKYNIIDGYAIDVDTGDKLGPVADDPDDWKSAARKIHAKNLEKLQQKM